MSRPSPRRRPHNPQNNIRINGRIRAQQVRVVHEEKQLGVLTLGEALKLARGLGVDLVEVSGKADPPVCRLIDFGKFKYEQSKKDKESKKHQYANKVKEVQLRPVTDVHDFQTKLEHAIHFLCEDMKVKVILRFRGRENMHKEYGAASIQKFADDLGPWGQPDAPPRAVGRAMSVMVAPLPRSKRADNPNPKRTYIEEEPEPEDQPEKSKSKSKKADKKSSAEPKSGNGRQPGAADPPSDAPPSVDPKAKTPADSSSEDAAAAQG